MNRLRHAIALPGHALLTATSLGAVLFLVVNGGSCKPYSDCGTVCDTYRGCFDGDYNVGACRARCADRVDDAVFRASTNACDECLSDLDCDDTALSCGVECTVLID